MLHDNRNFPVPLHIAAWLETERPSTGKLYRELLSRVSDPRDPRIAPGIKSLITATSLSRRMVFYALRRLEFAGPIRRQRTDSVHAAEITLVGLTPASPVTVSATQANVAARNGAPSSVFSSESLTKLIVAAGGSADDLPALLVLADGNRDLLIAALQSVIAHRVLPPHATKAYLFEAVKRELSKQSQAGSGVGQCRA